MTAPAIAIEAAWLTGLGLLPLAFNVRQWVVFYAEPRYAVLHFVALFIVAAWALDWAVSRRGGRAPGAGWSYGRLAAWAARAPGRWGVLAAAGFAGAATLSTLASPLPWVSLWGRDFNDLSNELYSLLSLMVIFFAIALRLRSRAQARRVVYVLVGAGALTSAYGVAQHFGWDALGPGAGDARVFASFGNPIFFGSYLVMSIMVTLAVALDAPMRERGRWLIVAAGLTGLQVAALWFTGSRGPWLGFAFGSAAFFVIGWLWLDRRLLLRAGGVLLAGVAIAAVLALLPADTGGRGVSALGGALAEAGALGTEGTAMSGSRGAIWGGALRLARTWEREPEEARVVRLLRPALGYGPEMYYYSYPLSVEIELSGEVASHAHNYPLQVFLELGLAGLITFAALAVLIALAGVRVLQRLKRAGAQDLPIAILLVGVLAALAGRAVEQMTGVARVADLAAFWALMGLVVALSEIVSRPAPSPESGPPAHVPRRRGRRGRRLAGASPSAGLVPLVLAVLVGLVALAVFIQRDVRMLRAGRLAAQGYERTETGEGNRALDLFERAADLAPDVERYHLEVSRLLTIGGQQAPDADAARAAYRAAYDAAARYERRDPYAYATQRRLATAAVDLAGAGEPGQLPEIADRYLKLAALLPSYPEVQSLAANGLVAAREFELGVVLADRAIAMETESKSVPRAWWARGEALMRLGDADEAERSFETAIERAPESQYAADSHRGLAKLLDERGEPDAAAEHRALAAEIEAALAAEPS